MGARKRMPTREAGANQGCYLPWGPVGGTRFGEGPEMNDTKLDKAELYANTVRSFARTGGVVFLLSTDAIFADVLRRALDMVQAPRQILRHHRSVETFLTDLREEAHNRVLVFLERMLSGQSLAPLLGSIGQICGEAAIIVLTTEIDQGSAALLIEYGAHNIITKPISVASVIEKMAFTIAPQGQMGRYIDRARRSLEMGSYEEAMRIASVVLQLKPDSAVAYMLMGDAYKGMGLTSKAEEMYLKASEVAKLYIQPLKRLSSLYEEAGDKSKQLEALKRLHEISPLNTQRLLEMGALEMEVGDPTAAEGYFEQAMQTARREAAEHLSRLSAKIAEACMSHNPGLAIRYSRQALDAKGRELSSADVETFNLLGLALRRQGRWREAVAEYRRALAVEPGHPVVLYNMALAYAEGGAFADAASALEDALQAAPHLAQENPNVAASMRTIFTRAGRDVPPGLSALDNEAHDGSAGSDIASQPSAMQ
ncbi:MAG: hypothetical protein PWP17_52 [Desulfomicrobiaceae bacterium]|nr:hypothetical protein [Desulfomicrobiaceae bacterium]